MHEKKNVDIVILVTFRGTGRNITQSNNINT